MEGRCDKHLFEPAIDICRDCGYEFCQSCLVYSYGPKKPPYCISCAVTAAGLRRAARNAPVVSKRERKELLRQRKRDRKQHAEHERAAAQAEAEAQAREDAELIREAEVGVAQQAMAETEAQEFATDFLAETPDWLTA